MALRNVLYIVIANYNIKCYYGMLNISEGIRLLYCYPKTNYNNSKHSNILLGWGFFMRRCHNLFFFNLKITFNYTYFECIVK